MLLLGPSLYKPDSAHYCLKNPYLFDAEKFCNLHEDTASSFGDYNILKTRFLIILFRTVETILIRKNFFAVPASIGVSRTVVLGLYDED